MLQVEYGILLYKLELPGADLYVLLGVNEILLLIGGEQLVLLSGLALTEALHEHQVELVLVPDHL